MEHWPKFRPCANVLQTLQFGSTESRFIWKEYPHIVDNLLIISIWWSLRHLNIDHFFELKKKTNIFINTKISHLNVPMDCVACACVHSIRLHMAPNILMSGEAKRRLTTKEQNLKATTKTTKPRSFESNTNKTSAHTVMAHPLRFQTFNISIAENDVFIRRNLYSVLTLLCCLFTFFFIFHFHCTLVLIIYRLFNAFNCLVYCYSYDYYL